MFRNIISISMILGVFPSVSVADDFIQLKSNNGIEFHYRVHDGVMDARVFCETSGWVAAGFDPTDQMADANIIIGYVDLNGVAQVRDDYGIDEIRHKADVDIGGTSDVIQTGGSESGGITRIDFTIPLVTKDSKDKPLTLGANHTLILACGKDGFKNFVTTHKKVAIMNFTL